MAWLVIEVKQRGGGGGEYAKSTQDFELSAKTKMFKADVTAGLRILF